jgi:hypothetical protein
MHDIYIERELGYGAMHSTDHFHALDRFFVIKIQIIDQTVQNDFRKKSKHIPNFIFFIFLKIVRKSLDLVIMSHSKKILTIIKNSKKIKK